ncbi:CCAAT-binding factor [Macleaya cordata]|uniref:CCAAT-binding factor n=1 Tax=Macleaya cordata TaxID=56857 RepID=A0A200PQZ9_MACCD|nr:CCAAT-binding factor [Macleaya cordata]
MASILATKQKKKRRGCSLEDVKTLGEQLLSSRAHINNLPLLLNFISPSSSPEHVIESTVTLQSFFIPVLPDLPSSSSKPSFDGGKSSKDPELVYKTWLRSQFDDFVKSLIALTVSSQSNETLRDVALDAIMEFVKLGKGGRFQSAIYHRFLNAVVHSTLSDDFLLDMLASKFLKYIDVRYYTYISLEKLATSLATTDMTGTYSIDFVFNAELAIRKIHYILSHIPPLVIQEGKSDYEMWSELVLMSFTILLLMQVMSTSQIAKKMKLKFTRTWLSFLRLKLPLDVYKEVLATLHQAVIPNLSNPIMLCDFLTRSYDIGGVISVMALSSLFLLMTQNGLEYPNFYEKLYVLLVPSIFMAKHRAKFFELVDSCLKSPLLPAYLAAAFAKKLSRLVLVVPPSGALIIIALIHNLLRRHPSINCLVHQEADDENDKDVSTGENEFGESAKESGTSLDTSSIKPGIDLFNSEESDPAKSNALRSSLWEIDTLRHHYCPAVSRFVMSLENDLTVRAKTTEINVKDFSSGSYATIFREATGRRIKQVPLAFYQATPTSLFSEGDFAGWTFKSDADTKIVESGNDAITEEDNHKSAKRQRVKCS